MEERIAVFDTKELPGSESRIDWAFFLGSSAGTLDADRELVRDVVSAGKVREGSAGRTRAAPEFVSATFLSPEAIRRSMKLSNTYLRRFLLSGMPL